MLASATLGDTWQKQMDAALVVGPALRPSAAPLSRPPLPPPPIPLLICSCCCLLACLPSLITPDGH